MSEFDLDIRVTDTPTGQAGVNTWPTDPFWSCTCKTCTTDCGQWSCWTCVYSTCYTCDHYGTHCAN